MINEFAFRNIVEIGKTVLSSSKILIKFGHKPPTDSTIICTIPLDLLNNFSTTKLFFSFFPFSLRIFQLEAILAAELSFMNVFTLLSVVLNRPK